MSYKANLKGIPVEVLEEGEKAPGRDVTILVVKQSEKPVDNEGRSGDHVCVGCKEPVWLHKTSTEIAPNARLICMDCLQLELRKEIN